MRSVTWWPCSKPSLFDCFLWVMSTCNLIGVTDVSEEQLCRSRGQLSMLYAPCSSATNYHIPECNIVMSFRCDRLKSRIHLLDTCQATLNCTQTVILTVQLLGSNCDTYIFTGALDGLRISRLYGGFLLLYRAF